MVTYEKLKELAEIRLLEAKVLSQNNFENGAIYLARYVIELALKACICKVQNISDFDVIKSYVNNSKLHDFEVLIRLSGLSAQLEEKKLDDTFNQN